jgi:hypothetical protein
VTNSPFPLKKNVRSTSALNQAIKNKHDFSKQIALKNEFFKKCQQQKTCP